MRFKIGDRVRVIKGCDDYDICNIEKYYDRMYEIKNVNIDGSYKLNEDADWCWFDDQLELAKESKPMLPFKIYEDIKIKIPSKEISMAVQEKLFRCGYEWCYDDKRVLNFDHDDLCFYIMNTRIYYTYSDSVFFDNHKNKEVTWQDILGDEHPLVKEFCIGPNPGILDFYHKFFPECFVKFNNIKKEKLSMSKKIVLENGNEVFISEESYKAFEDTVKDELDVSELFYGLSETSLINPYNKKQIMYTNKNGLQIDTSSNEWIADLKDSNKKAVLRDCEFKDLKVGDFFRYTDNDDWNIHNKLNNKGIKMIINIRYHNNYGDIYCINFKNII